MVLVRSPVSVGDELASHAVREISENFLHLNSYIPREFSSKSRSLTELDRWKATEFRQFYCILALWF